jgi:hypothetical protein
MSAAVDSDRASLLNTQRSRQVWVALILSAIGFFALCGIAGVGVSSYLGSITDTKAASAKALPPSVLAVLRHNTTIPEQITGTTGLQEGDVATTRTTDQAFITLFGDTGSIQMYFNTSIEMEKLRTSRFIRDSTEIGVVLHKGTIVFATGEPGGDQASYSVATDLAEVEFERGAHLRVSVRDEQGPTVTQVTVNAGKATMWARGKRVEIGPGEMAWVGGDEELQGPMAAQVDLIHNGSFEDPPTQSSEEVSEGGLGTAAWLPLRGDDDGRPIDSAVASVSITDEVALKAAVISGEGTPSRYVKVGITQDINEPASFFSSIELSATVKLVNQSLPAGGPVPDVYPLIIRIVYTDQQGKNHEWKRSFYFEGPSPQPTDNAVIKITQGRWTTTQEIAEAKRKTLQGSGNAADGASTDTSTMLFMLKSPKQVQDIAVINAIEIYGYGTQFQSWITGISLLAR